MREQNDLRRAAALGDFLACAADTGGLRFMPCRLADARPLAFSPPLGFLPSLRCHAGVLATTLLLSTRHHNLAVFFPNSHASRLGLLFQLPVLLGCRQSFHFRDAHALSTRFGYGRPDLAARALAADFCSGDRNFDFFLGFFLSQKAFFFLGAIMLLPQYGLSRLFVLVGRQCA